MRQIKTGAILAGCYLAGCAIIYHYGNAYNVVFFTGIVATVIAMTLAYRGK